LVVEIQKGILLYSCHIVRKFLNIDTEHNTQQSQNAEACRRVEVGYEKDNNFSVFYYRCDSHATKDFTRCHWIIHDHVIHELYCRGKTWVIAGNICSRWNEHQWCK
jgi:hypothetical protein